MISTFLSTVYKVSVLFLFNKECKHNQTSFCSTEFSLFSPNLLHKLLNVTHQKLRLLKRSEMSSLNYPSAPHFKLLIPSPHSCPHSQNRTYLLMLSVKHQIPILLRPRPGRRYDLLGEITVPEFLLQIPLLRPLRCVGRESLFGIGRISCYVHHVAVLYD